MACPSCSAGVWLLPRTCTHKDTRSAPSCWRECPFSAASTARPAVGGIHTHLASVLLILMPCLTKSRPIVGQRGQAHPHPKALRPSTSSTPCPYISYQD